MTDYIDQVFGPEGIFAHAFPRYEMRPGQVQLARAVDRAVTDQLPLLGEAPCGSGKTVAYAVPGIYHLATDAHALCYRPDGRPGHENEEISVNRLVIATRGIPLQHQLVEIDLPLLAKLLPWKFSYVLYKGRKNYLCLRALEVIRSMPEDFWPGTQRAAGIAVLDWAARTSAGDRAELDPNPPDKVWDQFSTSSDECLRNKCPHANECWANDLRTRMKAADVIVTNFHLLFADVAFGHILPPHRMVVLDEAHDAADVARAFQDLDVTPGSIGHLAKRAAKILRGGAGAQSVIADLRTMADQWWDDVKQYAQDHTQDARIREPEAFPRIAPVIGLVKELSELAVADGTDEAAALAEQCTKLRAKLEAIHRHDDKNLVHWTEGGSAPAVRARMIHVGDFIRRSLINEVPTVVATSATLTTNGTFEFIAQETGFPLDCLPADYEGPVPHATTLTCTVPSPFDFARQAAVVLPSPGCPAPTGGTGKLYLAEVEQQIERTLQAARGRTLILCTSYDQMNELYARVSHRRWPFRILRQGDDSPSRLAQRFRDDVNSCLFGVASFWAGLDVPGEALSAVVVTKLPFAPPSDPLTLARGELDPKTFIRYSVPRAVIQFRQGIGRLIRTKTDRGLIVICDPRVQTAGYAGYFMQQVPKGSYRTTDVYDAGQRILGAPWTPK